MSLPPVPIFSIKGRSLLPVVQGGMGVGVSAHRLAGAVARAGAMGTIASIDLRRHHPDLMRATGRSRDRAAIEQANLVALDREIRAARERTPCGVPAGKKSASVTESALTRTR